MSGKESGLLDPTWKICFSFLIFLMMNRKLGVSFKWLPYVLRIKKKVTCLFLEKQNTHQDYGLLEPTWRTSLSFLIVLMMMAALCLDVYKKVLKSVLGETITDIFMFEVRCEKCDGKGIGKKGTSHGLLPGFVQNIPNIPSIQNIQNIQNIQSNTNIQNIRNIENKPRSYISKRNT